MATPLVTPEDNSRERAERVNALVVPRHSAASSFLMMQGLRKWLVSFLDSEGVSTKADEGATVSSDAVIPTDATSAASLMIQLRQISDTPPDPTDALRTGLDVDAVLAAQRQILSTSKAEDRVQIWRKYAHFVMATTNPRLHTEAKILYDLFQFPFEEEERAQQSRIVPRPTASWRAMLVLTATDAGVTEAEAAALLGNLPQWYRFPSYTDPGVQSIPRVIEEVYKPVPDPRIRAFAAAVLSRFDVLGTEGVTAVPLTPGVLQAWKSLRDGTVPRKFGANDNIIMNAVARAGFSTDAALAAAKEAGTAGQEVLTQSWEAAPVDYGVNQAFAAFLARPVPLDKLEDLYAVLDVLDDSAAANFVSETTDPDTAVLFCQRNRGPRVFFFLRTITQLYEDAVPGGDAVFPTWTGKLSEREWERDPDAWQDIVADAVATLRKPEGGASPSVRLTKLSAINDRSFRLARRTTASTIGAPGVLIIGDDTPTDRANGIAVVHWIGNSNVLYITATSDEIQERVSGALNPILTKGGVLESYSLWPAFNIENENLKYQSALYVSLWIVEMLSYGFTAAEMSVIPLLFHGRKGTKFYNYIVQKWVLTRLARSS